MKKIIILILVCLFIVIDIVHIKTSHVLETRDYKPIKIEYEFNREFSRQEVKQSVIKLFNTLCICLEIKNAGDEYSCIPLRIVLINPDVDDRMYGYALAHGLTHIKYRTADEGWVSFTAFKTLYESNDDILKASALYYAEKVMWGWYKDQYDIGYYIIEYLQNSNHL